MTHNNTHNNVDSLLQIMQDLRGPDGCPWDREQTPESLTPYILEEACELIEAIESGSPEYVLDELGDLLLQVVFLSQIYREKQLFDFEDVAGGIAAKLVRRHPHVFDTSGAERQDDLDRQWEEIKRSEVTHNKTSMADHLPSNLPALQRAQKLVARAHRAELQEGLPLIEPRLYSAVTGRAAEDNRPLAEEELGQALFRLVMLANAAGLDAEGALRNTVRQTVEKLDGDRQKRAGN